MTAPDLSRARWRKSTYSGANNSCVEVARNLPGIVGVRDSKNQDGPGLALTCAQWQKFTRAIKAGEFDKS